MALGKTVTAAVAAAVTAAAVLLPAPAAALAPPALPALPAGTADGTPARLASTLSLDATQVAVDSASVSDADPAGGGVDPAGGGVAPPAGRNLTAGTDPAATGAVAVTAVGVRSEQGGDLVFALFRGAEGWPKVERAPVRQSVAAAAESVAVVFAGVPSDTSYAVLVLHDRNGNGKLDMRVFPFPKPKEGAGVSHNHTRMGPPRYEAARFAVADTLQALRVVLRY